jgi:hypothetical protein
MGVALSFIDALERIYQLIADIQEAALRGMLTN